MLKLPIEGLMMTSPGFYISFISPRAGRTRFPAHSTAAQPSSPCCGLQTTRAGSRTWLQNTDMTAADDTYKDNNKLN